MKLLKSDIMKIAISGGGFFKLYPLFLAIFYVITITSFGDSFFEDGLYIAKANSIIKDSDYNVINQVDKTFSWLVTKEYFHPTQHTEVQTPALVGLRYLETFLFKNKFEEEFLLASITLSLFCLYYGFYFCIQILKGFHEEHFLKPFLIFFTSTVFMFFSICYLSVSEIFSFPMTAYLLFIVLLKKEVSSFKDSLCFSICCGVLLISKSIYFFPFIMGAYYIFIRNKSFQAKVVFVLTTLLMGGTYYINMYDQFGGIELLGGSASTFIDFSFRNFFSTFFFGGFSIGGLFTSNPAYLPSLVFVLIFIFRLFQRKYDKFILITLLGWLGAGFTQTVFIVGNVVNDQFSGRLVLTVLPLLLIGFFYFYKAIKNKWIKVFVSVSFIVLHLFSLSNYVAVTRINHYQYATQKIVKSYAEFEKIIDTVLFNMKIANYNFSFIVVWSFVIFLLFNFFKKRLFFFFQVYTGILLLVFCGLSYSNSGENTKKYFESNKDLKESVVIGNSGEVYFYNYINDSLEFRMRAAQDEELRQDIINRRKIYYDIIKKNLLKSNPEFDDVLDNYIFYYGYYKEDK
ncbi:hypothetical protein [Halobacteriovorax sp. JY17]|uniref:hypothetical protein n=1 Tax=Halobacteriovorax sp. JY17 TaxID=2014617 RepID=UPI0025B7C4D0|nr:hypothetical protein [Halobacteriovorax sp. JY17]